MTCAKFLHGSAKTLFVRSSFERKLDLMNALLKKWKSTGREDGDFWPTTLSAFASWNSPDDGIHKWTTPNVMSIDGRYKDLVDRYWKLQKEAKETLKPRIKEESQQLKTIVRLLGEQNTQLVWQVMELRDALVRHDPNDPVLKKVRFP